MAYGAAGRGCYNLHFCTDIALPELWLLQEEHKHRFKSEPCLVQGFLAERISVLCKNPVQEKRKGTPPKLFPFPLLWLPERWQKPHREVGFDDPKGVSQPQRFSDCCVIKLFKLFRVVGIEVFWVRLSCPAHVFFQPPVWCHSGILFSLRSSHPRDKGGSPCPE